MTSTCQTPCQWMHAPQRLLSQLRVELEQRISTHWHKETLEKAVRNAARRINASTVTI